MKISFRLKTILGIALIEFVLLATLIVGSLDYLKSSNIDEFNQRTDTAKVLFSNTIKDAVLSTDLATLDTFVKDMITNPGVLYVRIRDQQQILAESGDEQLLKRQFFPDREFDNVTDGVFDTFAEIKEDGYIYGRVELGFSVDRILLTISDAKRYIGIIAALEMFMVALFSYILGTYLTRQLRHLENAANIIESDGPGALIPVTGNDEIAQTATAFNKMSLQLEKSYKNLNDAFEIAQDQTSELQAVMDNVSSGIILIDHSGEIQLVNQAIVELYGLDRESLKSEKVSTLISDWRNISKNLSGIKAEEGSEFVQRKLQTEVTVSGNNNIPVEMTISEIELQNNSLFIIVISDISYHVENENKLNLINDKLRKSVIALEETNSTITRLTQLGTMLQKCVTTDEAYSIIEKYGSDLFPNLSGALFINQDNNNTLIAKLTWGNSWKSASDYQADDCWALRGGVIYPQSEHEIEIPCKHVENDPHHRESSTLCVPVIAKGKIYGLLHLYGKEEIIRKVDVRFAVMVAEQISMALFNIILQVKLHHASIRDPLTGLYNRRFLGESLSRELHHTYRKKQNLSIILADIDHFKMVNDTHGHDAGDYVLKEVARSLINAFRKGDIVCRYGGEEFLIVCPDTSLESAAKIADKLRKDIELLALNFEDTRLNITLSLGVTTYRRMGETDDYLISRADKALYQAKAQGRNCVVLDNEATKNPKVVYSKDKKNTE